MTTNPLADRRADIARAYWQRIAREQRALEVALRDAGAGKVEIEAAVARHQEYARTAFARSNPINH